jgi:hypothetical protein
LLTADLWNESQLGPGLLFRVCLVQRGPESSGHLGRIVIGPEMHEEQPRLLRQHVAVKRRYLNPVIARSAFMAGFASFPKSTKSPVIAVLPPPVG